MKTETNIPRMTEQKDGRSTMISFLHQPQVGPWPLYISSVEQALGNARVAADREQLTCTSEAPCHLFTRGLPCRSPLVGMDTGHTYLHTSPHFGKFTHKPLPQTLSSLSLQSCSFQAPRAPVNLLAAAPELVSILTSGFLSSQADGLLGEPLHLYLSDTLGEAAWCSIPSVPGASTFTKQSITWVLGWHSSAHRESPEAITVGSRGLGGAEEVPRVSATCSCDFLMLQRCAQGWHHLPHQPPLDSAVRHAAQLTHSRGVWYLVSLYQCPAADLELLFKWRIVIFSSCIFAPFPLESVLGFSSWDLTQTPCPRSVGLSGEGVTKAHSDEVQVVF